MVAYERIVAGLFSGTGALILIWKGEVTAGVAILASMVAFFIGEKNGARSASQNPS
jgi:uncharacterized membrane-anchored protein YitT (DUF2179 family)